MVDTKFISGQFFSIVYTIIMYLGLFEGNVVCFEITRWPIYICFVICLLVSCLLNEYERSIKFSYKYWPIHVIFWGGLHCFMFLYSQQFLLAIIDCCLTSYILYNGKYIKE